MATQAVVDAGQEVKDALHGAATGGAEMTKSWFENIFGDREYYNWSYFVGGTGRPWWSRGVVTFITSGGAMTWWAVACVTISLFVTRFGPLAACLTGTKSDNMYASYNGTCVPADYANEDVAGLTALVIGMFIMFIGFFIWLGTLMPFREAGVIKLEPFAQAVFALMFFVIGIWCVMFSTYTFTTNKSLDTYNMNPVPNVNNTYQPPNYRDLVTPNGMPLGIMIPSIICLIIGSIYLLMFLSAWVWTDDSLDALHDVNLRSMALNALAFVYMAVGFAVGVTWQYANPSGSYPTSLVAKQCFLTSVIFYCFGAVEVISLWAANWSDPRDVDWTLYVLPAWFWQLWGCDYGRV